jgi:tetratricopeptide (TPR) repeat protein
MYKAIIISCALLGGTYIYGQSQKITKLNLFYKHLDGYCKEKVVVTDFCSAIGFYRNLQLDSCYVYAGKALEVTKKQEELDILYYIQGVSAINKKLFVKSLQNMNSISEHFTFLGLKDHKLGEIHLVLENYDQSIQYYKKWLDQDTGSKDVSYLKTAYHNLGISHLHKKEYVNTKHYFSKELALIKKEDTALIIRAKMEFANAYYSQYKDEEAIALFKEAYRLATLFHDIELKQNTTKNMGW